MLGRLWNWMFKYEEQEASGRIYHPLNWKIHLYHVPYRNRIARHRMKKRQTYRGGRG